jgi:sugar lactone lactonase YvrE
MRGEPRHHLSSKVMCWVALDRAVKLAPQLGEHARVQEWAAARDEIREAILTRGWSEKRQAYAQSFESDELDGAQLLMPSYGFLPATDGRMRSTIEAIARDLTEDGLVLRYRAEEGLNADGLTFSPDGLLTICQHGNRRVIRVNPHGDVTVLADRYAGKRLNSPNDLVYRSDGTLYLTDPPFGLPDAFDDPAKELPFSGVFKARDGVVTLVTDELAGPNGLAFSPDERYLYVGNWDPQRKVVMRYEIDAAGDPVGTGEVFHDMTAAPGEDAIDGIKVDGAGNVYVCGPGGIWVLSPRGERLGLVVLPEDPHNLAWGDADGRTLYITAMTSVYRMRPRSET